MNQLTGKTPTFVIVDDFEPARATELKPGVTLHTKDSSAVGNAIVVREVKPTGLAEVGGLTNYLERTGQKLWLVETDFGNRMRLCDNEIFEMFNLAYQQDYDTWWDHRIKAIEKTVD